MIIKTCDKCGDKINTNPMTNVILPMFSIKRMNTFAFELFEFDRTGIDIKHKLNELEADLTDLKKEEV